MRVLMFTNTFVPQIGGVARSVGLLAEGLRNAGHDVLVIAPQLHDAGPDAAWVVRVPAVERAARGEFVAPLPLGPSATDTIEAFAPDIVHSHHPFLLGHTALRVAAQLDAPVVFTHHTRYEHYAHYLPCLTSGLPHGLVERFARGVVLRYANLCDAVIAPSESVRDDLRSHGVEPPIATIPTAVSPDLLGTGDPNRARAAYAIPPDAFVIGHVGRLAKEKNLEDLTEGVGLALGSLGRGMALVAGDGEMAASMEQRFAELGLADRVRLVGALRGSALADAYAAMDAFVFTSHTETQGLVLVEAMAAGTPVIALDAPGAREVVEDGANGFLLPSHLPSRSGPKELAAAIERVARLPPSARAAMRREAAATAALFSVDNMTQAVLAHYRTAMRRHGQRGEAGTFSPKLAVAAEEARIAFARLVAARDALRG